MRILLIEDDPFTAKSVKYYLSGKHTIVHAQTCETARSYLAKKNFDTILLDINLPDGTGLDFCQKPQANSPSLIIISGKNDVSTKVHALESGADDYLTKPFTSSELYARIHAVHRRREKPQPTAYTFHGLQLLDCTLSSDKNSVHLTKTETQLIQDFLQFPQQTLNRQTLLRRVGKSSNLLETHIKNIRQKLTKVTVHHTITTIYGEGYSLQYTQS